MEGAYPKQQPPPPGYNAAPPGYGQQPQAPPPYGYPAGPPPGSAPPGFQPAQPAQPGYAPPAPGVVLMQPVTNYALMCRDVGTQIICPFCQANIVTATRKEIGGATWLIAGGLCIFGAWPCAPIPFCVDACKDTWHSCPNCNRDIHKHNML